MRGGLVAAAVALAAGLGLPGVVPAAAADPYCAAAYAPASSRPAAPLRLGIDPELAGSVGTTQTTAVPLDPARDAAALARLRAPGAPFVLRLNRLFESDGEPAIQHFADLARADVAGGFEVEVQVRYHPSSAQQGDMAAWTQFVRRAVSMIGPIPGVIAMTVTNEVNIAASPNTSDGGYTGAEQALILGVEAARAQADVLGRQDLLVGFTYAYRFTPQGDAGFWQQLAAGGDAFRRALGFVGVDDYPGSFYPPAIPPTSSPGAEVTAALATVRDCYMPMAGLGSGVPIWVTENGYPTTRPVHSEAEQADALTQMVTAVHDADAALGVTDYRWFNLRDNRSSGTGTFDTDGLLRDDYSEKPSFARFAALVRALGAAPAPPATAPVTAVPAAAPAAGTAGAGTPTTARSTAPTLGSGAGVALLLAAVRWRRRRRRRPRPGADARAA